MYQPADVVEEDSHLSLTHAEEVPVEYDHNMAEAIQYVQMPTSPGGQSTSSSQGGYGRKRKKSSRQAYNKASVRMDQYFSKDPDQITAKELRALIPQMFFAFLYPNKEVGKTKVKGLWEKGNQPRGWPSDVTFRDPNNQPKMNIMEMRKVFKYLKDRLGQNPTMRSRFQPVKVKCEPTSPVAPSVYQQSPPLLDAFQPQSSHLQGPLYADGPISIQEEHKPSSNFMPSVGSPPPPVRHIPSTVPVVVDDYEREDAQAARDHGVHYMTGSGTQSFDRSYSHVPESTLSRMDCIQIPSTLEPMAGNNQPIEVINQAVKKEDGQVITDLTVLHSILPNNNSVQVVNFEPPNGGMIQLVQAQTSEEQPIAETAQPTNHDDDGYVAYATKIEEDLVHTMMSFSKCYESQTAVTTAVKAILCETFDPLYQGAMKSKTCCMKFSKFSCQLQEILKRYTLMSGSPEDIVKELDTLRDGFTTHMPMEAQLTVLDDHCVPYATNEVIVMRATDGIPGPRLNDSIDGPYIPTIAQIEERALQKQLEIESPDASIKPVLVDETKLEEKVKVEKMYPDLMSPMCEQLGGLNVNSPEQDPEKDLGISLKRTLSCDDESSEMRDDNEFHELLNSLKALSGEESTDAQTLTMTPLEQTSTLHATQQTQAASTDVCQSFGINICQPIDQAHGTEQDVSQSDTVELGSSSQQMYASVAVNGSGPVSCTQSDLLEEMAIRATLASAHGHFGGLTLNEPFQKIIRSEMNDLDRLVVDSADGLFRDYMEAQNCQNNQNQLNQTILSDDVVTDSRVIFVTNRAVDTQHTRESVNTRPPTPAFVGSVQAETYTPVFKVPEPRPPTKKVPKMPPVIPLTVLEKAEAMDTEEMGAKKRAGEKGKKYGKGSHKQSYGKVVHCGGRHEKRM